MNSNEVIESLAKQIKYFVGDKYAVVGVSGGVDSAVVAALCVKALGKDKVLGLQMPYGDQSTKDGDSLIKQLGIYSRTVNIKPIIDAYPIYLAPGNRDLHDRLVNGNIRARTRMTLLYALAGCYNGLVIGTSNRTEIMIGYITKYGDGGCDCEPIGDLYKTEIFEIAEALPVPLSIIDKKPSAELWEGQTDEDEIGLTYKKMDKILHAFNEEILSLFDIEEIFGEEEVNKVIAMSARSEHKRKMPPVFKVRR